VPRYARASARILLIDSRDRILLLASWRDRSDHDAGRVWMTPGGGRERRETLVETAVRELREEIGLSILATDLGRHVAFTEGRADLGFARGLFRDDFFVHRVASHDVDVSGFADYERADFAGFRWWPIDEIERSADPIYPWGLVPLMRRLLAGDVPAEPVALPWHH
jgi:8-oxo-dGTP pyrophosphatase MutT (NUDIX family)